MITGCDNESETAYYYAGPGRHARPGKHVSPRHTNGLGRFVVGVNLSEWRWRARIISGGGLGLGLGSGDFVVANR